MEKDNESGQIKDSGRDEINKTLDESKKIVGDGTESIRTWADKLKNRFAPVDQKRIEFNEADAVVTLTKTGSVILTFVSQEDAKKYFEEKVC